LEAELLEEDGDETPSLIPPPAPGPEWPHFPSQPIAERGEASGFIPPANAQRKETAGLVPQANEQVHKPSVLVPRVNDKGNKPSGLIPPGNAQGMKQSSLVPSENERGMKSGCFIPPANDQAMQPSVGGPSGNEQGMKEGAFVPPPAGEPVHPSLLPKKGALVGQLTAGEPSLRFREAGWAAATTLLHIMQQPAGNGQREMAKLLGYSASGVAKHMSRMQRLGLIVRVSYQRYGLTEKSWKYVAAAHQGATS
jgi:hypothetical protein